MKKTATRSSLGEAAATVVLPARFSADAAPAEVSDDLGHRLKRVRIDKGWTLKEVSERTGVARSTLSKIENGQMSPQKRILPFKARIKARSLDEFPGWVRHDGEEFLCVLSGTVQVFTEFYTPVTLEVGDSTYFDSKMGHAIVSLSKEDAEVIWICTGITALS